MREDPIFYQDWDIGIIDPELIKVINWIDIITSFLISLAGVTLGILFKVEYVILLWLFFFFFSFIIEVILADKSKDQINNKLLVGLFLIVIFYYNFNQEVFNYKLENTELIGFLASFVLTFFLIMKFLLILLYDLVWRQLGEVLIPKNSNSLMKKQNQYELVMNTKYKLSTNKEIRQNTINSLKYVIKLILVSIIMTLLFLFSKTIGQIFLYSSNSFLNLIGIILIISYAISILIIWLVPLILISELIRIVIEKKKKKKAVPLPPKNVLISKKQQSRYQILKVKK